MKIAKLALFFATLLAFGGCSAPSFNSPCGASPFGKEYSHKKIDFDSMMSKALSKITSQISDKSGMGQEVVVTDFVNVENLSNKNQLGFILSSALKNELAANRKFKIIEVETSKYFKIGEDGVTLLSRTKSDSLRDELGAELAFVGTYAVTDERVIVYIKLINLTSGKIEAAATVEEPMTCEIKDIFDSKTNKVL